MSICHVVCHILLILALFTYNKLIIQYFFVFNKVSGINVLKKTECGAQTSKKNDVALGTKGCPSLI